MARADAPTILSQIAAALRGGAEGRAIDLAQGALDAGLCHPLVLQLCAEGRRVEGRLDLALDLLQEAAAAAPGDPAIVLALAQALAALGRPREAVDHFDTALGLRPGHPPSLLGKGQAMEQLADLDTAYGCYREAARQLGYAEPRAALALIAANAGRAPEARAWAHEALQIAPNYRPPRVALASADLLDSRFAPAEAELAALLRDEPEGSANRGVLLKLMGDALHGQARYDEAWLAYSRGNAALHELYVAREPAADGLARQRAVTLAQQFTQMDAAAWRPAPSETTGRPNAPAGHAFLVGFPRSGTTLLEQALARHPQAIGLEERATLAGPLDGLLTGALSLRDLAQLPSDQADRMRALYWSRVEGFAGQAVGGRLVLDKMPLNLMLLPLIHRLFPHAKIIFALRDPRDVVLSCFRQRFLMTPAMAEFVTIESAAAYYDAVMRLARSYRQTLPLALHVHRYENMIADFDGRVGEVLSFLGLDWRDEVRDFAAGSATGLVNTPSSRQIGRGLYTGGIGQWRRYAHYMAEANAILQPWIQAHGYGGDEAA